jgi:hypothetical protein
MPLYCAVLISTEECAMKRVALTLVLLVAPYAAFAQTAQPESPQPSPPAPPPAPTETVTPKPGPDPQRLFIGGGFALSFGTVYVVEIFPIVTYRVIPRLDLGGGIFYRYRDDGRYDPSFTANDYGASLFARFRAFGPMFLQAQYSYENYEYPLLLGGTERSGFNSVLGGVGYSQSLGGRAGIYAVVLYNFNYDSGDPRNPYSSPWEYQIGFGVGF